MVTTRSSLKVVVAATNATTNATNASTNTRVTRSGKYSGASAANINKNVEMAGTSRRTAAAPAAPAAPAPRKDAKEAIEPRVTRSSSRMKQKQNDSKSAGKLANPIQTNTITSTTTKRTKSKKNPAEVQAKDAEPKKLTRHERRRNEALLELRTLGKVASLIVAGHRRRRQSQHPDAAFMMASLNQSKDAGRRGGLMAGSRHHYDRSYRS